MRWLQHLLTIVLAISLTSSAPGAVPTCGTKQMDCSSAPDEVGGCCASSTCHCELSVPNAQQSRPDSAVIVHPVSFASAKNLTVTGALIGADSLKCPAAKPALLVDATRSFQPPLYTLNHAFLI